MIRGFMSLVVLCYCQSAFANDAAKSAIAITAGAGLSATAGASLHNQWIPFEVEDWRDSATETTTKLDHQCETDIEARLLGNSRYNYLYLGLRNGSDQGLILKPERIKMAFTQGRERSPFFMMRPSDIEIKPGWRSVDAYPFPSKWDFRDQDGIKLSVPLYDSNDREVCSIQTEMTRDPDVKREEGTHIDRSAIDYTFEFGTSLLRTGDFKSFGDQINFAAGVTFYIFPFLHHGLYFGFFGEGIGGVSPAFLQNATGSSDSSLSAESGFIGYAYRAFPAKNWQLKYDGGFGGNSISYSASSKSKNLSSSFALNQKISLDYTFGRLQVPNLVWDNSVGISLYQIWVPTQETAGVSTSGNSFGASLHYKFGI